MSAPAADLGAAWLASVPDGAAIHRREVRLCTVKALFDGFFSARMPGEARRRYFDTSLVADDDRQLLSQGAQFWEVAEWTGPGEVTWAVRFRRPGVTAEQAFRCGGGEPR